MAIITDEALGHLKTHDMKKFVRIPLILNEAERRFDKSEGEEVTELIGCNACNMGLEEAGEVDCPGADLFDMEAVFGPSED